MMLYCGPGPERMLSGVVAAAIVAAEAEAEADKVAAAVSAAIKIVLLNYMAHGLRVMLDACVTRRTHARSEVAWRELEL